MGRKLPRQTFFMELFQALKIFDVAVIALFILEGGLAIDRGAVRPRSFGQILVDRLVSDVVSGSISLNGFVRQVRVFN